MTERTRLRLMLAASLGASVVVMIGLPLLLLLLPNPAPHPVRAPADAGRGVYASSDGRTWRLFPRAVPLDAVPADAPTLRRGVQVVVAARQPGPATEYRLARIAGPDVGTEARIRRRGDLALVSIEATLDPGAYELRMPRESMFGGTDYAYFLVNR